MKTILKIILLLIIPAIAFAQSQETEYERLHTALKDAANDTIRMDTYMELALYYNEINKDSSLYYQSLGIPLAQKLNFKLYEAHFLENQGYVLTALGNYPRALESFLKSQKIAEDPASDKYVWNLPKGQTPRKARLQTLAYLYLTMGHLYGATNNTDKQISSYLKSKEIAESIHEKGIITTLNMNLGWTYFNLNKLDSALFYAQTTLDSNAKNDIGKYSGGIYGLAGAIYWKQENYDQALNAFKTALKLNSEQNNLIGLSDNYNALSSIYLFLNKPDSSLFFANKGLETSKGAGSLQLIADAYSSLSSAYSKLHNTDSAYVYLKLASSLRDSLYSVDRKNLTSFQNLSFNEQIRLRELEAEKASYQNKIRTNTLMGGLFTLLVIAFFLYRNNKQKQKANKILQEQKEEIQTTLEQLEATQSQLIQSEKMASLGELTAGIAHEIQNPLNFVNNFSEVSNELIDEMNDELDKGDITEAKAIASDIKQNLEKINHHGKRADAIVKGMLQHSRTSSGVKEPTDINALADEYLRLAYHGLRAKDKSFNAAMNTDFDSTIGKINIIPQDIGRVILNLITNAFYVVNEKKKTPQPSDGGLYEPTVTVKTSFIPPTGGTRGAVLISVRDNGNGIPDSIKDKIFQPFFTTKPTGSGTGLGLSLSYDIVKAHGGELKVETKVGEGAEFIIHLPLI